MMERMLSQGMPLSSNTAGLTWAQFFDLARKRAEERGLLETVSFADGSIRRRIPRGLLCELRDELHFGPLCEVNPFGAELCWLPRGYRFACGQETFADFANLNTCLAPANPIPYEPTRLAA